MNALRIAGVLLLAAGLLAFVTGSLGWPALASPSLADPLGQAAAEGVAEPVPAWISLAAMVLGGAALVLGFGRR